MEYVEGRNLQEMIESGDKLSPTVVLRLMITIADALDYMHSRGIVHRNVKPRNIIVSLEGNPVLTDFGLSGPIDHSPRPQEGKVLSTPAYMAPEAFDSAWDFRSDLWSLGVTLHELLTGRTVFEAPKLREFVRLVRSSIPPDLSDLRMVAPEPVVDIVARCLQRDLSERYQSAAEVRRDLEAALAYMESADTVIADLGALHPARTVLLNVEYPERGIPGQYRQFTIREELGKGSFAVVYRATDVMGKREVALKILPQERASQRDTVARFRREAGLLSRVDHPNIVRVHNFGRSGAELFIVMEIVRGVDVRGVLRADFTFSLREACAVLAQVLFGLAKLHEEGVVHRDIKPANIMLERTRAVVMDLGIAHLSDHTKLTLTDQVCGTLRYMAPEQARGEPVVPQTDLYAVGVVLYEMLTGQHPHGVVDGLGLVHRIAFDRPVPITRHRSDLPESVVRFLDRVLLSDHEHRYGSSVAAREALLSAVGLSDDDVPEAHRAMWERLTTEGI